MEVALKVRIHSDEEFKSDFSVLEVQLTECLVLRCPVYFLRASEEILSDEFDFYLVV